MYKSAIVDELGTVIDWVEELDQNEVDTILEDHPEWRIELIDVCPTINRFNPYDDCWF